MTHKRTFVGAKAMGVAFTLSTIATSSIEEIAEGAAGGLHFFQVGRRSFLSWCAYK